VVEQLLRREMVLQRESRVEDGEALAGRAETFLDKKFPEFFAGR
jgi:hypothetical protein